MIKILKIVLGSAFFFLLFAKESTIAASRFQVGALFPDIVLPALEDGRPLSLTEFRGEKVILHIFASW